MKTITITFRYNEGKEWQDFWDNYIAKNISCANPNGDIQVPTWYADIDCVDGFKELLEAMEGLLEAVRNDELIPDSVSYMKQADEVIKKARGE